jgi:hypothetical protein
MQMLTASKARHVLLREWSQCATGGVHVYFLPRWFGSSDLATAPQHDMEAQNLQAASTYVNNILLARGLLKTGHPIDFAQPDNEDGGTEATMARVINLVNDLVLRRDVSRCYSCLSHGSNNILARS